VYPVSGSVDSGAEHETTPKDSSGLQVQLEALREERDRERRQLQATIDDLRGRLDEEAAERRQSAGEIRRLTLLLTDQRPPTAPPQAQPEPAAPAHFLGAAPWLFVFLAVVAIGATGFLLWEWRH
jgi:hypothetical protein